jgi:hypothetical protein
VHPLEQAHDVAVVGGGRELSRDRQPRVDAQRMLDRGGLER